MPSITFTVTAADAARLQAAAIAYGYPDVRTMIISYVKSQVEAVENAAMVFTVVSNSTATPVLLT